MVTAACTSCSASGSSVSPSTVISDRLYGHVGGVVHAVAGLAACGRVSRDGSFVFEGVPAGEYTLKVLRGAEELHSASVTVTEGETTLEPIAATPAGN